MTLPLSNNNLIDSLIYKQWPSATYGTTSKTNLAWTNTVSTAVTLHYSFESTASATFISECKTALKAWANVANINFIPDASSSYLLSNISITDSLVNNPDNGSATGFTTKTTLPKGATNDPTTLAKTNTEIATFADDPGDVMRKQAIIHELGHALGFKHPGDYYGGAEDGPFLPTNLDYQAYTVMSYGTDSVSYTTPMIFDALAMQYLYGANHNYNSGNTRYTLTTNMPQQAIWDGGGIDTLDSSSYTGDVVLDLREGYSCVTSVGTSRIWLDYGSNIENATSGNGNDVIYGSHLDNNISSGAGNDTIYLVTGAGADTIDSAGHAISPTLNGSGGNDTVSTGTGNDKIFVNSIQLSNHDSFINSGGIDTVVVKNSTDSSYQLTETPNVSSVLMSITGSGNSVNLTGNDSSIKVGGNANNVSYNGDMNTITVTGNFNVTQDLSPLTTLTNTIEVNGWCNHVIGGYGHDIINLKQGAYNTIDGGSAQDTITFNQSANNLIHLGSKASSINDGTAYGNNNGNIITGGGAGDTISLTGISNLIDESKTAATIQNTVTLYGNSNTVNGGEGINNVTFAGNYNLFNDHGVDSASVTACSNIITINGNNNTVTGGAGADTITIATGSINNMIHIGAAGGTITDSGNQNTLYGSSHYDSFILAVSTGDTKSVTINQIAAGDHIAVVENGTAVSAGDLILSQNADSSYTITDINHPTLWSMHLTGVTNLVNYV